MLTYTLKYATSQKRWKRPTEEVERYFPGFLSFIDFTEQQIPRPVDKKRKKEYYSEKKEKRHNVKNPIWVNTYDYILHKVVHKKGRKDIMTMTFIKKSFFCNSKTSC